MTGAGSVEATSSHEAQSAQEAYLRQWFKKSWATVSLAEYGRDHTTSLLDVYVPLPTNVEITIKTVEKQIVDWWNPNASDHAELMGQDGEKSRDSQRRSWHSLHMDEAQIQPEIDDIQRRIREEEKYKDYRDGEHTWYWYAKGIAQLQPRFVLVGVPGSGKSSFIRHLCLCLAGQLLHDAHAEGVPAKAKLEGWSSTPIYLELRDLVEKRFAEVADEQDTRAPLPTLDDFWAYVQLHYLGAHYQNYEATLRAQLEAGKAIILLDGLDEGSFATAPRRREQVQALVHQLSASYPKARIILTSRPHAYRGDWALDGFGSAELRPLYADGLQALSKALFSQLLEQDADQEAEVFYENVTERVPEDLRTNPLYFTLLAQIWLRSDPNQRTLPQSVSELYRLAVGYLLEKWTSRPGTSYATADALNLTGEQLRQMLQILALEVHASSDPKASTTDD